MSNTNTGGPAFPHLRRHVGNNTYEQLAEGGMTLRDYFAAKAMQAIVNRDGDDTAYGNDMVKGRAILAYEYADAMLKAREQ
jgi:hypothetical protein